jgi:hypothetical protein
MRPTISEFSYGFALTHELVRSKGSEVSAAPVFPSLIQEGAAGGGFDLKLITAGLPLFLQFKLCDVMQRRSCDEFKKAGMTLPCYRMHLRSARYSQQHELLLELEGKGNEVYYAAPAFHQPDELNEAFLGDQVRTRSIWVKPSDIGKIDDKDDHHLSFRDPAGPWKLFSTPRDIATRRDFGQLARHLEKKLDLEGSAVGSARFSKLADEVEEIAQRRHDIRSEVRSRARKQLAQAAPVRKIAYYSTVFLEAQLFLVQKQSVVP